MMAGRSIWCSRPKQAKPFVCFAHRLLAQFWGCIIWHLWYSLALLMIFSVGLLCLSSYCLRSWQLNFQNQNVFAFRTPKCWCQMISSDLKNYCCLIWLSLVMSWMRSTSPATAGSNWRTGFCLDHFCQTLVIECCRWRISVNGNSPQSADCQKVWLCLDLDFEVSPMVTCQHYMDFEDWALWMICVPSMPGAVVVKSILDDPCCHLRRTRFAERVKVTRTWAILARNLWSGRERWRSQRRTLLLRPQRRLLQLPQP